MLTALLAFLPLSKKQQRTASQRQYFRDCLPGFSGRPFPRADRYSGTNFGDRFKIQHGFESKPSSGEAQWGSRRAIASQQSARIIWHRGKLPFKIPNFAKFCHKNMNILPQK